MSARLHDGVRLGLRQYKGQHAHSKVHDQATESKLRGCSECSDLGQASFAMLLGLHPDPRALLSHHPYQLRISTPDESPCMPIEGLVGGTYLQLCSVVADAAGDHAAQQLRLLLLQMHPPAHALAVIA